MLGFADTGLGFAISKSGFTLPELGIPASMLAYETFFGAGTAELPKAGSALGFTLLKPGFVLRKPGFAIQKPGFALVIPVT